MAYVPLPEYRVPTGVNFEPVNQALEGIIQQQNQNRQFGLQEKASSRADQQFALEKRNSNLAYESDLAKQSAGIAQAAINERDPAKKAGLMTQLYGLHPEYKGRLASAGIDPNDYDTTANFIVSQARGYVNPLDAEAARAKIDESRASAAKSTAEARMLTRQGSLLDGTFGELGGGNTGGYGVPAGGVPERFPTSGAPLNNQSLLPPPGQQPANALASPRVPVNALSPAVNPALEASVSGMPRNALAARPSIPTPAAPQGAPAQTGDQTGYGGRAPSSALPNPGDPTSFSGGSASGTVTPERLSPDTIRALKYDLAFNGGKGSSSIINNDPGTQYAKSYAIKTAEDNAAINMKQKMTAPMLDIIHGMREKIAAAGPDIADMATGPNYGSLSDDPSAIESFVKAPLPDTSGEFYQNARAGVRNLVNSTLGYIPGVGQFTQPIADAGNKARNLNLELHHLVKGIGAGVKAIPGTKGGGTSTDADQALVLDAVGEAMHSADAATRNSILFDAENILRARAGQARLPAPPGYQPSYLAKKYDASSTAPADAAPASRDNPKASAIAGARDAIARGADPSAVRQRLMQNGINPDGL